MFTMYRAYQPTLPTANLYLQEKWDRSRYAEHRRKVAKAIPAVDCKGSQTPTHLLVNMKKNQMDKDQQALTEKQNYIHFTKLNAIKQSHGRLDNWNYNLQHSLNVVQRRQNLSRITQENGNILKRILKRESEYGGWKSEWEKAEQIRANISRYPQYSGPDWVGQQTVTFMDIKRHVDIPYLVEESKTECIPSRSTLKLVSNPQRTVQRIKKEPSFYTYKRKQINPLHDEQSTQVMYGGSTYCDSGQGATYSYQNTGTFNNTELAKTDHKLQTRFKSRVKTFYGNSENNINCVNPKGTRRIQEDSEIMEDFSQENGVVAICQSPNEHNQETTQSIKKNEKAKMSYQTSESDTVVSDTEKEPHISYVASDKSFDFSPVESDTNSCYSLHDSDESSNPSTSRHSARSETQSSQSLNLKTRSTSKSPTSHKSLVVPETLLQKLEISNTFSQNIGRSSQNFYSEESTVHYPLLQPTKHSSLVTNRSPDPLVHVTIGNEDVHSQRASMTVFSPISSSSRNRQRSPDLINQKTLVRDPSGISGSSSKVSTKIHFEDKIYKALYYINEALYK